MKKLKLLMMAGLLLVLSSSCEEECENTFGECPDEQLARDVELIEQYIEDNNLTAERLTSYDLFYIIEEQGSGEEPQNGQNISVNYVGKFLDGRVFDTSIESVAKDAEIFNSARTYEPFNFTLGQRQVILGWDVGLKLIGEGGKATLILPSYMAYGPRGSGVIPANAVLIFEVELVSINEQTINTND